MLVLLNIGLPVWALYAALRVPFSLDTLYQFAPQLGGAMFVASEAALVALILSLSSGGKWVRGSLGLMGASFLVGGQLLAIALIRLFNRSSLMWAYNSSVVTVVAYIGRFGWLALAAGLGTWSRPWRELRDIASVDGAGTLRTAAWIVWPMAWPMLLAGGLLVGALSLTEVPATVLLMPQHPQVLTPTLMTWVHMVRYDSMIQASLLMMASVLVPALAGIALTAVGLRAARWMGPRK
jgi:iron(III) transport system permease protein